MGKIDIFFSLLRSSLGVEVGDREQLSALTDDDICEFISLAKKFDVSNMLLEAIREYDLVGSDNPIYEALLENEECDFFQV